jgi:hypothetical protein
VKAGTLTRHYDQLTPKERFQLIVAAGARGDTVEQDRLKSAGERRTYTAPDYAPWSHAFEEVAMLIFLELLDDAGEHNDTFRRWCDTNESWTDDGDDDDAPADEGDDDDRVDATPDPAIANEASTPEDVDLEQTLATRYLDLYLAQGFMLKTKLAGWKTFCEQLSIPPFAMWKFLPGFDRLRRTLERLEDNEFRPGPAFLPEGMRRWLSEIRPDGQPEPSMEDLISPERFADGLDEVFRERVEWWGG